MAQRDTYSNFSFYQAMYTVLHDEANAAAITGRTIDTRGYEGVTFVVTTGEIESMTTSTASYFCFILEHTDASALGAGPSDYTAVTDGNHIIHSVQSVGTTLTSGIWEDVVNGAEHGSRTYAIGYIGPKRYTRIRVSGTLDSAASINIGAIAILGYPANWPINDPA